MLTARSRKLYSYLLAHSHKLIRIHIIDINALIIHCDKLTRVHLIADCLHIV